MQDPITADVTILPGTLLVVGWAANAGLVSRVSAYWVQAALAGAMTIVAAAIRVPVAEALNACTTAIYVFLAWWGGSGGDGGDGGDGDAEAMHRSWRRRSRPRWARASGRLTRRAGRPS